MSERDKKDESRSRGDPRFKKMPRKKTKVVVGDRFAKMFTDKDFQDEVPSLPTDKYGIKRSSVDSGKHIRSIYKYDPEVEEDSENDQELGTSPKHSISEEDGEVDDNIPFEWNEESSSDLEEDLAYSEEEEEEDIPDGDETKRIAIMNLDWDYIKAKDIFHLLRSFLPNDDTSSIKKVSILPSLFGLERMKIENEQGPQGIWKEAESSSEEDESTLGPLLPLTRKRVIRQDQEAFDEEKLRKYQRDRLKYYFAVVEFTSKEAALHIYNSCNDLEIEQTSNRIDMRFIPDDVEFEEQQKPKDTATSAPIDHKLPDFHTKVLQHSRVKLTWDQDDPERLELTKKLRDESLYSDNAYLPLSEERRLQKYLATSDSESSDDSSDEEEQAGKKKQIRKKVRNKYSSLLKEIHHSDVNEIYGKASSSNSGNMDMEITFTPGITDSVKDMVDRKMNNSEDKSSWEQYLEKSKEKKRLKRQERRLRLQQQQKEEIEEREKRKRERKKMKKKGIEDDEVDPELEKLVSGSKKSKKSKEEEKDDDPEIDPRFIAVVDNPKSFGYDRTNPNYKASSSFVKKVHRKREEARQKRMAGERDQSSQDIDTKSIVEKLRRKSGPPLKKRRIE